MIELTQFQAAQKRIAPHVRRTPMLLAHPLKSDLVHGASLYLKLEQLQISGSFKARGAVNKLLSLGSDVRGLVTASGGNHGLGVAYAGWLKHLPTTIFLPNGTPAAKAAKIKSWGAEVQIHGNFWDEANAAAIEFAKQNGLAYLHPFADATVIAGQGTIGLEMLEDVPDLDVVVVAIGGGGLISGVSSALKLLKPNIEIIGVEPVGAPTLTNSLQAGEVVSLPSISTKVGTLAPGRTGEINFDIIAQTVSRIELITDEDMEMAQNWLWQELGMVSELSGAAALAAVLTGKVQVTPEQKVAVLICGSNTDLEFING